MNICNNFSVNERVQGITLEEEFKRNPECPVENFYEIRNWLMTHDHLPKISGRYLYMLLRKLRPYVGL